MRSAHAFCLALALLFGQACDQESPPGASKKEPAAPTPGTNIDPKIAAVASAAVAAPVKPQGTPDVGPPPNGILTPEKADQEARRGEAAKIALGSDGVAPRVALQSFRARAGGKEEGTIQVILQSDPSAGSLPLDFNVAVSSTKGKGREAPAPGTMSDTKPAPSAADADPVNVLLTVKSAKLNLVQGAEADELNKKLTKLKGSTLTFTIAASGAISDIAESLPKDAGEEFADVTKTLAEGIALLLVPYPAEPVGAGAYWMVTGRNSVMGLDVVTYRMVKVAKATPNQVELGVSAKRYVAGSRFDVPRVAQNGPLEIDGFEASAEGSLVVGTSRIMPLSGQVNATLSAILKPNAVYQSQSGLRLDFGASKGDVGASKGSE